MDKLRNLYHCSPKNYCERNACVVNTGQELFKIVHILDNCPDASTLRSVKSALNNYLNLYEHFTQYSFHDKMRSQRKCYIFWVSKKLGNSRFVVNFEIIYDALEELCSLSQEL